MGFFSKLFKKKDSSLQIKKDDKIELSIKSINKKSKNEIEFSFIFYNKKEYILLVIIDEFTGEKTIKFTYLSGYMYDKVLSFAEGYDFIRISYGIRNINGIDLIYFDTYQKTVKFKKGDIITFLFIDDFKIDFELLENGYRIDKDSDGVVIESRANISKETLEKFKTTNVVKWRYVPNIGKPITGTLGKELSERTIEMFIVYSYFFENDCISKVSMY